MGQAELAVGQAEPIVRQSQPALGQPQSAVWHLQSGAKYRKESHTDTGDRQAGDCHWRLNTVYT